MHPMENLGIYPTCPWSLPNMHREFTQHAQGVFMNVTFYMPKIYDYVYIFKSSKLIIS
jgi:hypothetical protein